MPVCVYARMCVCPYVRMCVCVYARMYVCVYVRMYVPSTLVTLQALLVSAPLSLPARSISENLPTETQSV